MERYEFIDDKTKKFWEVSVEGSIMSVCFGRIGAQGRTQEKDFGSASAAEKEKNKLVLEKTGKGYKLVGKSANQNASTGQAAPTKPAPAKSAPVKTAHAKPAPAKPDKGADSTPPDEMPDTGLGGNMERYEYTDDKTKKFWEVSVEGSIMSVRFGRIGAQGQAQEKDFGSASAAEKEKNKLVMQKTSKGYKLVSSSGD